MSSFRQFFKTLSSKLLEAVDSPYEEEGPFVEGPVPYSKYNGWACAYYPSSNRYYPMYKSQFIIKKNEVSFQLTNERTFAAFAMSKVGAEIIVDEYLESIGVGVKIYPMESDGESQTIV
jgi:hypothetical protein